MFLTCLIAYPFIIIFRHGDMLYLTITDHQMMDNDIITEVRRGSVQTDSPSPSIQDGKILRPTSAQSTASVSSLSKLRVIEDEVDRILEKEDGRVERKRHEQLYVFFVIANISIIWNHILIYINTILYKILIRFMGQYIISFSAL